MTTVGGSGIIFSAFWDERDFTASLLFGNEFRSRKRYQATALARIDNPIYVDIEGRQRFFGGQAYIR
jgi:hypothetical protein